MSVTSGFFNSVHGDRRYFATQISEIFDGILRDGIFASIGTCFAPHATTGLNLSFGEGRAWFNHVWIKNDAILLKTLDVADLVLDRIDCYAIEINHSDDVRLGDIVYIKGTPSSEPKKPEMKHETYVNQYPLCYVTVAHGAESITDAEIETVIGSESTPFVTGILDVISLDELLGQWRGELDNFVANETADLDAWYQHMKEHLASIESEMDLWKEAEKASIDEWFEHMKDQLSTDAAINLQNQIDRELIVRKLMSGFEEGTKVFSDDGLTITSTTTVGARLVKVFASDFSSCTTTLYTDTGAVVATMIKNFSADGKTITTELNIRQ